MTSFDMFFIDKEVYKFIGILDLLLVKDMCLYISFYI